MSFVYGMARQACNVWGKHPMVFAQPRDWVASDELFKRVDFEKVRKAINKNDVKLAWEQWAGVESFIEEFCIDGQSGLWSSGIGLGDALEAFRFFATKAQEKGMEYWFPEDPLTHWVNILEGHSENDKGYAGWESYLIRAVADKRNDTLIDDVIAKITAPPIEVAKRVRRVKTKKPLTSGAASVSVAALATSLMSNEKKGVCAA